MSLMTRGPGPRPPRRLFSLRRDVPLAGLRALPIDVHLPLQTLEAPAVQKLDRGRQMSGLGAGPALHESQVRSPRICDRWFR